MLILIISTWLIVGKRLGHKNIKTTMDVYSHLLDEVEQKEKEKAMYALENMSGNVIWFGGDVFLNLTTLRNVTGTFRLIYEVQRKLTRHNKTPLNQRFVSRDLTRYKQITETEGFEPSRRSRDLHP